MTSRLPTTPQIRFPFPAGAKYTFGRTDQGLDMTSNPNTPVLAAASGTVHIAHDPSGFGNDYPVLIFDNPIDGNIGVYYGHIAADLAEGTHVNAGQQVGHTLQVPGGDATVPGWLEMGWWGANGPTGDGQSMAATLAALAGQASGNIANAATAAGEDATVQLQAFMAAIRTIETGSPQGDYTSVNQIGCKSAYQFCPGTDMYAKAQAANWDPSAVDQIAAEQMVAYYKQFGSWESVAQAWLGGPGSVGNTGAADANGTTVGAYGQRAVALMNQYLGDIPAGASSGGATTVGIHLPSWWKALGAIPGIGGIINGIGAATGAPGAIGGIARGELGAIGQVFDAHFWHRVFLGAVGVVLIIGGVTVFLASTKPGQEAISVGAMAAAA